MEILEQEKAITHSVDGEKREEWVKLETRMATKWLKNAHYGSWSRAHHPTFLSQHKPQWHPKYLSFYPGTSADLSPLTKKTSHCNRWRPRQTTTGIQRRAVEPGHSSYTVLQSRAQWSRQKGWKDGKSGKSGGCVSQECRKLQPYDLTNIKKKRLLTGSTQ